SGWSESHGRYLPAPRAEPSRRGSPRPARDHRTHCQVLGGPNHPQPAFQRLPPGPAHFEPHSILELHLGLPPFTTKQRLDQIQSHDDRSVNAHELRRVQLLLEVLHPLANEVSAILKMEP